MNLADRFYLLIRPAVDGEEWIVHLPRLLRALPLDLTLRGGSKLYDTVAGRLRISRNRGSNVVDPPGVLGHQVQTYPPPGQPAQPLHPAQPLQTLHLLLSQPLSCLGLFLDLLNAPEIDPHLISL